MNNYVFDIKCPILHSMEGMMLGNGTLGALVYADKKLTVSIDRIDLWDYRMPKHDLKVFNYDVLLDTIKNDYKKCYSIFDDCYNNPTPTKINAGKIVFDYETNSDDVLSLNMKDASLVMNSKNIKFNAYVDANEDVIVIEYSNNLKFDFVLPPYFYRDIKDRGLAYRPSRKTIDDDGVVVIQDMYDNHSFGVIGITRATKDTKRMYLSIFKDGGLNRAKKMLKRYIIKENEFKNNHLKWWDAYFATSLVDTPDDKINSLYLKGKYFFACNSRKNYPMTLHGVWTKNDGELPPWKIDIHNDLNTQMLYEGYLKTGNYNEGKVLCDYLYNHRKAFKQFASEFMHSDGWLIPGVMSIDAKPLGGWPQYSLNPVCSIWLIKCFKEYYEYTGDTYFLKHRALPFFKNVEKCIRNILVKNNEGKYELGFHSSPEYFENEERSIFKHQTNFELTMLRYLYESLIEFSNILGFSNGKYKEILSNLSDFYRNDNGELMISIDQDYDMSHRHFSHMLAYKNMMLYNPYEDASLIAKDINKLVSYGGSNWVGFSYVELAGLFAFIDKGEEAYKYLSIFEDAFIHENGFHMNNDFKNKGYSEMTCYVMTLEANVGFVTSLNDMMVKSFKNYVTIFPAIPESFKQGCAFNNLKIHNNHSISGEYKSNKLSFRIVMSKKDKLIIKNNFENNPTLFINGVETVIECPLGETFVLECDGIVEYSQN